MSILEKTEAVLRQVEFLDDHEIANAARLADLYKDIKPSPYRINSDGIFAEPQNQNQAMFSHHANL